jgi:hypothetical protein
LIGSECIELAQSVCMQSATAVANPELRDPRQVERERRRMSVGANLERARPAPTESS